MYKILAAEMLPENQTEYTSVSVNKVWDDVTIKMDNVQVKLLFNC